MQHWILADEIQNPYVDVQNKQYMRTEMVNSLKQLRDKISRIDSQPELWFRGQSDSEWILVPSIGRKMYAVSDYRGKPIYPHSLSFPKDLAYHQGTVIYPNPYNLIKKYRDSLVREGIVNSDMDMPQFIELAQHYGLPTPLLDWTVNLDVALYFAISGYKPATQKQPALYCLNPKAISQSNAEEKTTLKTWVNRLNDITIGNEQRTGKIAVPAWPVSSKEDNPRVHIQEGRFTLSGLDPLVTLDTYRTGYVPVTLFKYTMSPKCVSEVKSHLKNINCTQEYLFPESGNFESKKSKIAQKYAREIFNAMNKEIHDKYKKMWQETPLEEKGTPMYEIAKYKELSVDEYVNSIKRIIH